MPHWRSKKHDSSASDGKGQRRLNERDERMIKRMEKGDYEMTIEVMFSREYPVYLSGETVQGDVVITTSADVIIKGLQVEFLGMGFVRWGERDIDKEVYISEIMDLCHMTGKEIFAGIVLEAGGHRFPFMTVLPQSIPASFQGSNGGVRYLIKATIVPAIPARRSDRKLTEGMSEYGVLNVADLNLLDRKFTLDPIICRQGLRLRDRTELTASWDIPHTGYAPGEVIHIYCSVRNDGTHRLDVAQASLVQYVGYVKRDGSHEMQKRTIGLCRRFDLPGRDLTEWKGSISVPLLPPTGLTFCSLMDIWYIIEFYIDGPGLDTPLLSKRDVIIGSIPVWKEKVGHLQQNETLQPALMPVSSLPPPVLGALVSDAGEENGATLPYHSKSYHPKEEPRPGESRGGYHKNIPDPPSWQSATPPEHWYNRHYATKVQHHYYQSRTRDLKDYRTHTDYPVGPGRSHHESEIEAYYPEFGHNAKHNYTMDWLDNTPPQRLAYADEKESHGLHRSPRHFDLPYTGHVSNRQIYGQMVPKKVIHLQGPINVTGQENFRRFYTGPSDGFGQFGGNRRQFMTSSWYGDEMTSLPQGGVLPYNRHLNSNRYFSNTPSDYSSNATFQPADNHYDVLRIKDHHRNGMGKKAPVNHWEQGWKEEDYVYTRKPNHNPRHYEWQQISADVMDSHH